MNARSKRRFHNVVAVAAAGLTVVSISLLYTYILLSSMDMMD